MISAITRGPAATRKVGEALARLLQPSDVVLLVGGLGSGKTTFVQGLARGLGVTGDVTSPTFTLCHTYPGRLDLVHVDLWRLARQSEILDLGLEEELDEGAVVVVEWGEAAEALLGDRALVVEFRRAAGEDARELAFEAHGPWRARAGAVAGVLGEVTV
ncbi:MAG TPA: tRNA (adenosine(37)-N6)-threonylcarbamoyltransferase complex ATPase subunit type 1 TsaE [Acidimicrobiales bacterium]|nr:tRNA (adenosine(37)-N6)-threonylcarbamoyltransferase complex ATPase subunit type 1 TsaE [Acidimicrobiales bacterium]